MRRQLGFIMERRCSNTLIRSMLFVALLILSTAPINAQASDIDKPISIGSITANPQANNRRVVLFKGKAIDIRMITGGALAYPLVGRPLLSKMRRLDRCLVHDQVPSPRPCQCCY